MPCITLSIQERQAKAVLESLRPLQEMHESVDEVFPCPRCGGYHMGFGSNLDILSRYANVHICPGCGRDEAVRELRGEEPLPFSEWSIIEEYLENEKGA